MKKMFAAILLIILSVPIMAQWTPVQQGVTGYGKYIYMSKGDTLAQAVYMVNSKLTSAVSTDTLAQNDTVTVYLNNLYEYVYISITDTATATGDSIYVQVSNSDTTAWSAAAVTDLSDLSTDAFMHIATNLTKRFRVAETYPFAVRFYKPSNEGINTYWVEGK